VPSTWRRALGLQSEEREKHIVLSEIVWKSRSPRSRALAAQESGLPVLTDDAQHEAFDRLAALVGRYGLSMQGAEALTS